MPLYRSILLSLLLALLSWQPVLALDVPAYRGYVNDYGEMLSPAAEQRLEQILSTFERSDSTQIAVLTIASLEGDALEDFSIRVVDTWQIGQRGKDNGVLLLVVKKERKIRLEVGYGLEGVLTDLLAGRIIDSVITPAFRRGDFDGGISAGVAAVIKATRGEFKAEDRWRHQRSGRRNGSPFFSYLLFAAFLVAFLGRISKPLGVISGALLLPLLAFTGFSSLGLLGLLLLMPIGGFGGLLLPLLLANSYSRGGFYMGGGGFGSGGGFGGGGFGGFGGGGFGGGGASGDW